ncbi:MAG TPA: GntR family transcriptional regulator [Anaerolineales bacterium]|nr:GntR family transcriptional regulator [Anaerolineales bacterium]HNC31214.1 GntR family transcriptional regulator [Cyclobacteriaceae bacterium]HNE04749.1 GntR family transcriptional regulator [Anaerolineales bacterium]HNH26292.1 GntR family transcriptional regulator [Anaerolineales bacterium]HNM37854.1 GntR family transcriptional regulator [Anaerolineales bacterium]
MAAKELSHKPLKEEIYDALHRQIIAGRYGPGDWLRQEDIASQMGVSMTPVREALDLLVAKGIAERVPYRGVRVREMSPEDVVEAYGMRLFLEAMVARETALNITPEQVQKLENIMAEMDRHVELNEMPQERQLSREFHSAIAEASGNKLLVELYSIVSNAFPDWLLYEALYRQPELVSSSVSQTHDEHAAILNAFKKHDPDLAVKVSLEHVMESGRWLENYRNIPAKLLREKEKQVSHLIKKSK